MDTSAKIICDSVYASSPRITTFEIKAPRIILSEILTHRAFSRNASSSRAIPISKMIEQAEKHPFIPKYWGKNQKGMQAREEITGEARIKAEIEWLKARDSAVASAKALMDLEIHKQIGNRLIETFLYTSMIITATDFDNFFALRHHPDAQPEIKELAEKMLEAYVNHKPIESKWHLPYVLDSEKTLPIATQLKFSVARCCRVSYNNHDNTAPNPEKDIKLHDDLIKDNHMSPTEHQAESLEFPTYRSGNFVGWRQYRKTIPNENRAFNYETRTAL